MAKETILITGGSGLVGSRLIEILNDEYEFIDASLEAGIDLLKDGVLENWLDQNPNGMVWHLAAFTDVAAAERQRENFDGVCYLLNYDLTRRLAESCLNQGRHLIYFSTDYVFDGEKEGEYTELDPPAPQNWYGYTKYLGEREVVASGVEFTILRIAYPFRQAQAPKPDFVHQIVQGVQKHNLHPMFVDQVITPTFVDDMARGLRAMMEHLDLAKNETFHLVGDDAVTPYELAEMVARELGGYTVEKGSLLSYISHHQNGFTEYPFNLGIDNKKFKQTFGFKFTPLNEALKLVR